MQRRAVIGRTGPRSRALGSVPRVALGSGAGPGHGDGGQLHAHASCPAGRRALTACNELPLEHSASAELRERHTHPPGRAAAPVRLRQAWCVRGAG